ncbi:MAG: hypothetical protein Q8O94_00640 [bacterium]|nr:hypothetical protein [bacterium]
MKPNTSAAPFIIALLIAALGIYWYFSSRTGDQPALSASKTESPAQTKFQTLVGQLTPITFNTTIFSDARFNAFVDLTTPVAPEPSGRLDPFAAVTGISGM